MLGGAGVVAIASVIIGVRLLTNRPPAADEPTVAPPPLTQPADPAVAPPPVSNGTVRVNPPPPSSNQPDPNANQNANPNAGASFPPVGPPNVVPPPPDPPPPPPPDPVIRTTPPPPPAPPVNPGAAAKERALAEQYNRAKNALDSGSFAQAVTLFETLQREENGYRDVAEQIGRAKAGIASAVKQAMDNAAKLEGSGDLPEALKQLERVTQIDPSMSIVAEQAMNRVRTRMRTEGNAAFTNAKQLDAIDRVDDAIVWYERAFRLLPEGDPNKKTAKERLDLLRSRK
jgi:tetratricopeptide (TPR) repeat protein